MDEETRFKVYKDWAERFDCDISSMTMPNVIVREHSKSLKGYNGIYCFFNGTTNIISSPTKYTSYINRAISGRHPMETFDANFLVKSIDVGKYKVIGPAFQGYIDRASFLEASSLEVVELVTSNQLSLLYDLRKSCSETEWEHSSIEINRQPILARISDERIVAAGSWRVEESGFLSVGILSHPDYRGKGHAKAVVSALTRKGLEDGFTMHYQTLMSNGSSVAIAKSLGFEKLACTLAIRILE